MTRLASGLMGLAIVVTPLVYPVHPAGGPFCDVNNGPVIPREVGPREPLRPFVPDQRTIV